MTAPTAIGEADGEMVAKIARFTAQLVLGTLIAGTGWEGRGEEM